MAPRLVLALALIVCLVAPAAAQAGELSREGSVVVYRDTSPTQSNDISLISADSDEHYIMDDDSNPPTTDVDGDSGCTDVTEPLGLQWMCTGITGFRVETGGANDSIRADLSGPDNTLSLPLVAMGGEGNDFIVGGSADDTLDGGFGQDGINGGAGNDVVSYADRTEGVVVDLGQAGQTVFGSANDGAAGARDFVFTDVEGATGGSGDDALTGGDAPAVLRGGPGGDGLVGTQGVDRLEGGDGADSLNPLGGADTVLAGAGVDSVETRDGQVDTADCGPDGDHALADSNDLLTSCDPPAQAGPPDPVVIVTPAPPVRVLFDLAYTFAATRRGTVLRNLAAEVEPGARITAACRTAKNKRCTRTRDLARGAASARLKSFEGKRLPVGARLTVRVTKDGMIGAVKTLTIRKRKAPSLKTLCLPPGAAGPSVC